DRRRLSATILLLERSHEGHAPKDDIRKLVFERLNTGGQQLNAQELRNCLWAGAFNDCLIELAATRAFTRVWDIPDHAKHVDKEGHATGSLAMNKLYSRMGDCEIVLRYFALRRRDKLAGSMRDMLDDCMEANTSMSRPEAKKLSTEFLERLAVAEQVFGAHVFRYRNKKGRWLLSRPLFDGILIALDSVWSKRVTLVKRKARAQKALAELLQDGEAYAVLVGKPNTANAVKARIDVLTKMLRDAAK